MKKRHVICLLSFPLLAVAAAATLWILFPQEPRFTEAQHCLLKPGMSKEEVIGILGPPGDYTTFKRPYVAFISDCYVDDIKRMYGENCWCGDHGAIGLRFGPDGNLKSQEYFDVLDPPPTVSERLKGWLSFGK
jgi:hypothetical protein